MCIKVCKFSVFLKIEISFSSTTKKKRNMYILHCWIFGEIRTRIWGAIIFSCYFELTLKRTLINVYQSPKCFLRLISYLVMRDKSRKKQRHNPLRLLIIKSNQLREADNNFFSTLFIYTFIFCCNHVGTLTRVEQFGL